MLTIVEPKWELLAPDDPAGLVGFVERCGRVCYKSEERIKEGSADTFVRKICRNRHESVLEHASLTVVITCSRAASHQLVRHRIAAYSQESMRYCNYGKLGYQVVCPPTLGISPGMYQRQGMFWKPWYRVGDTFGMYFHRPTRIVMPAHKVWLSSMQSAYDAYKVAIDTGQKPEDARFHLPQATKTEVVTTFNVRMWRHVFKERAFNKHAQWEIRGIFKSIFDEFVQLMPAFFEDLRDSITN